VARSTSERITVTEHADLDHLVATGQAIGPSRTGPVAMPPDRGDAGIEIAAELVAARNAERW
jgi:hypothetical protein